MQPLGQIMHESDIVDNLRQSSKGFREFYVNERDRAGRIEWHFNPHLSEEIIAADAAHYYHIMEKYHEIHLRRFPVLVDDARLVAHEITHAILAEENHSLLIQPCDERNRALSTYLDTMFEDPVVDSFLLERYQLDLTRDCLRRLPIIRRAWETQPEPLDRLPRLETGLLLASQMMKWRLITDSDALQRWSEYLVWFSDKCPNIFLIAVGFVATIKKFGLGSLDTRKEAFNEIVKNYQLEKY
jgi:hypothetical protein